jgi:hypothetical protein
MKKIILSLRSVDITPLTSPALKTSGFALCTALLMGAAAAHAQVNLSGIPYSQSFDSLGASGAWADDSTLTGWYAGRESGGTVTPYASYANTGGGGTSSSTLYSMATSSGDPDRAIGGAPSTTGFNVLGLRLVNDTGSIFDDVQISYDFEQWSDRGMATITMSYQVFAPGAGSLLVTTGWNTLNATDSPLTTNPTPVSGIGNTTGLIAGVTGGVTSLGLQAGDELWVRWAITKIGGNNSTHGIDNVVVAVPEPSTAAFLGVGLLLLIGRLRPGCVR